MTGGIDHSCKFADGGNSGVEIGDVLATIIGEDEESAQDSGLLSPKDDANAAE